MHAEDSQLQSLPFIGSLSNFLVLSGAVLVPAILYFRMICQDKGEKPTLVYKKSDLSEYIIKSCSLLNKTFRTPVWARSCHIQMILGLFTTRAKFAFRRGYVPMKYGGMIALDWGVCGSELTRDCPIFIALPGITGNAKALGYICKLAASQDLRPVVFNKRGHGGSKLETPKLQSFGDPSDLREVVLYIRHRYPVSKLVAVGVSAGSALLTSYLGEYGSSDTYITAAVHISPGYYAQKLFNGKLHPLYEKIILFKLKRLLKTHFTTLCNVIDFEAALSCTTLAAFEEIVYCQLYKFKDIDQYWAHNEPMRSYRNFSTPALCINALDDPVCRKEMITYDLFKQFPDMILATTERGGHWGFVEAGSLEPWADRLAVEYLSSVLKFMSEKDQAN